MVGSPIRATVTTKHCPLCNLPIASCTAGVLSAGDEQRETLTVQDCDGCCACEEPCPENGLDCCFEIVWGEGSRAQIRSWR